MHGEKGGGGCGSGRGEDHGLNGKMEERGTACLGGEWGRLVGRMGWMDADLEFCELISWIWSTWRI